MEKYGLIGYPLGHSFSISYFNQKFQDEAINAVYENFEIPTIDALDEVLDSNPNLRGLNVTIPYKEKVLPFLDSISPEARAIGAVNVIRVTHEGKSIKLKGYNSDVIGFTKSIEPMLDKKWHKKALILGTGASLLARGQAMTIPIAEGRPPTRPRVDIRVPEVFSGVGEAMTESNIQRT